MGEPGRGDETAAEKFRVFASVHNMDDHVVPKNPIRSKLEMFTS
jgi:hypothetical protein